MPFPYDFSLPAIWECDGQRENGHEPIVMRVPVSDRLPITDMPDPHLINGPFDETFLLASQTFLLRTGAARHK